MLSRLIQLWSPGRCQLWRFQTAWKELGEDFGACVWRWWEFLSRFALRSLNIRVRNSFLWTPLYLRGLFPWLCARICTSPTIYGGRILRLQVGVICCSRYPASSLNSPDAYEIAVIEELSTAKLVHRLSTNRSSRVPSSTNS